jgi:hypothetical protein
MNLFHANSRLVRIVLALGLLLVVASLSSTGVVV